MISAQRTLPTGRSVITLLAMMSLGPAPTYAATVGDAARGKELYQACTACHAIDENDLGPRHRGVVGRRAGSLTDYAYSPALKASNLTWNRATLDRWLAGPSAIVPGTKMYFQIDDAQKRADIIAYLAELK